MSKMNRGNFLKSVAILISAPKDIIFAKPEVKNLGKKKIAFWCKITPQLREDTVFLSHYLQYESRRRGIDLSKPYTINIGYDGDDFTRNLLTCIIEQYV